MGSWQDSTQGTSAGAAHVFRGSDGSLLYEALGRVPPVFGHVPLLLGPDGVRLSKRHRGVTLRELRDDGFTPERIVGRLASLLGLRPTPEAIPARALVDGFSLDRIRPAPNGIVVDPAGW